MRYIKEHHPIHIHGFSPSEVVFFSERFRMSVPEVDTRAERSRPRLYPRRRRRDPGRACGQKEVAGKKAMTDEWLGVQAEAHRQGMTTSVTMMYGMVESDADRIEHLLRIRDLQAETGGFTAFICWPLQPDGTELAHLPKTDAVAYLRTNAMGRIICDNIPNIQSSWVTMGHKVGQVALRFGANDYGSLMMEENVVSAAGTTYDVTLAEMERVIRDAGYEPKRRRQDYTIIEPEAVPA